MTITDLIARLKAAETKSSEMDAEIVAVLHNAILKPYPPTDDFGPKDRWQFWSEDGKHFLGSEGKFPVPPYTTSLDAALTLVPEGLLMKGLREYPDGWSAEVGFHNGESFHGITLTSAPLALCIAALKAIELSASS